MLLHHDKAPAQTSLITTESVTNSNMIIVPHSPYSLDFAPCDFALLPKLKMKLKEQRFERVSDIQRELQAVFGSIKEIDFHGFFEVWKKVGIAVYVPKEIILKEMTGII
jgi:hypothetical protein